MRETDKNFQKIVSKAAYLPPWLRHFKKFFNHSDKTILYAGPFLKAV